MSPKTRAVYKAFSHKLRSKETQGKGMGHAQELAKKCMDDLPDSVYWRVHLEMADLAKREKNFHEARRLYRLATELQPSAPQTWLEYAKMEEERGHFERCRRILTTGLKHCPYHEALMLKAIKHLERMNDLPAARALLGTLQRVPINQSWRTLLEGALLEARTAETETARRVFKFLLTQAPWYGPVWHEACRFEQRCNHLQEALRVAEQGLQQLPRYGPLWFCALRLYECTSNSNDMMRATRNLVERGVRHISKDLVWKLWFESAQVEERNNHLQRSRAAYVKSVNTCAANLRWKVWLGGARTELCHREFQVSQDLLERAYEESPPKTRAIVMLEQSRLHELRGKADLARKLLKSARRTNRQEWKVFLESVLLELRSQDVPRALQEARKALKVHRGTGRLWAVLIQLEHAQGVERQLRVFQQALHEVPKSGEVWCEGARICLNPFSAHYNLHAARQFLDYAIEFTPQYGDSFIEYLRLLMLLDAPRHQLEQQLERCVWPALKEGGCMKRAAVSKHAGSRAWDGRDHPAHHVPAPLANLTPIPPCHPCQTVAALHQRGAELRHALVPLQDVCAADDEAGVAKRDRAHREGAARVAPCVSGNGCAAPTAPPLPTPLPADSPPLRLVCPVNMLPAPLASSSDAIPPAGSSRGSGARHPRSNTTLPPPPPPRWAASPRQIPWRRRRSHRLR